MNVDTTLNQRDAQGRAREVGLGSLILFWYPPGRLRSNAFAEFLRDPLTMTPTTPSPPPRAHQAPHGDGDARRGNRRYFGRHIADLDSRTGRRKTPRRTDPSGLSGVVDRKKLMAAIIGQCREFVAHLFWAERRPGLTYAVAPLN